MIDPRAIIDPQATLEDGVEIGPWAVIGEGVRIGRNTVVAPHCVIQAGTQIGARCRLGPHSVIGASAMAPDRFDALDEQNSAALSLGAGVTVHALSRVVESIAPGVQVEGNPARIIEEPTHSSQP